MSKKKTHEEYVAELAIKNPAVEVIGRYVDSKTKIEHRCLIHDVNWDALPNNALKGCGCRRCGAENSHKHSAKIHEDYVLEVKSINPNIVVLGRYVNAKTPILHKCLIDGYEWYAMPTNILGGQGCPECAHKSRIDSKRRTHEQYVKEVSIKMPTIEVTEQYIDSQTNILHHCLIHDFYWKPKPNNVLNGYGCPLCGGSMKKTHEEYVRQMATINPDIEVIGEYINSRTPILHKCLIHNVEWMASPTHMLQGSGCWDCHTEKIKVSLTKSNAEYIAEVAIINPYIEVVGTYVNAKTPILHKCLIDGNEWFAAPDSILAGTGCPKCKKSKGEKEISYWLENRNISYIFQKRFEDCIDKSFLPFDFYLPDYNICIEYDGKQHFEPIEYFGGEEYFEYIKKHDNIKTQYCIDNNIKLLRIPYFKNIEEELNNFLFI